MNDEKTKAKGMREHAREGITQPRTVIEMWEKINEAAWRQKMKTKWLNTSDSLLSSSLVCFLVIFFHLSSLFLIWMFK